MIALLIIGGILAVILGLLCMLQNDWVGQAGAAILFIGLICLAVGIGIKVRRAHSTSASSAPAVVQK